VASYGTETKDLIIYSDITFNSVRSIDIKPKLRPENKAEKPKHVTMMIMASHTGINGSNVFIFKKSEFP